MSTKHYHFRLIGLREAEGQIKATVLQRTVDALLKTTERATRLLATGEGSGRGQKPRWLKKATDFTITGLKPGSTILDIEAPTLRETACEVFGLQEFRLQQTMNDRASLDDTPLDLASLAVREAQGNDPPGDRFDSSVLEAILDFRKITGCSGIRYELTSQDSEHGNFVLDDSSCMRIEARLTEIPAPRAFIVSGRLDKIEHDAGRFRLLVSRDSSLLGLLDPDSLDVEALRPLWGRQTTVEGMVYFKVNGQPRLIEARRISSHMERDTIFEEMPVAEIPGSRGMTLDHEKQTRSFDPMELWGTWPGDESIEELLADLD